MRKSISADALGGAISELLQLYHEEAVEDVNAAGKRAVEADQKGCSPG